MAILNNILENYKNKMKTKLKSYSWFFWILVGTGEIYDCKMYLTFPARRNYFDSTSRKNDMLNFNK